MMEGGEIHRVAQTVARRSYGKLVALLSSRTRDLPAAEDALSEAFAAALKSWPLTGIPDNPEGWLLVAAKRKIIDAERAQKRNQAASGTIALLAEELSHIEISDIPDHRLALMFACAHPAIDGNLHAPLMLQTVLGFDAATIASAFLISPAAMSQRLVRAKTRIRESGIPFRVPERTDLKERLQSVLEAIYAVYAEGWADPAGTDAAQRELASEAIWLGRLVVMLLPDEPEALGLLSLMLHCQARCEARRNSVGDFIPLSEQNPEDWDAGLIAEAEAVLLRASKLQEMGRFQLEAAVQSAHAARRISGKVDFEAVVKLYDALFEMTGSPVVAINRAIAIGEIKGAQAGLAALDGVESASLSQYQPYWSARAHLLARTGRRDLAGAAYDHAIGLAIDPAIRSFLQKRKASLA
jgi:RNA polymerase sigma-70 factor (ECF subfamily)